MKISYQTSKMEHFAKLFNSFKPLTIFRKSFILESWQGSESASGSHQRCYRKQRLYSRSQYSQKVLWRGLLSIKKLGFWLQDKISCRTVSCRASISVWPLGVYFLFITLDCSICAIVSVKLLSLNFLNSGILLFYCTSSIKLLDIFYGDN